MLFASVFLVKNLSGWKNEIQICFIFFLFSNLTYSAQAEDPTASRRVQGISNASGSEVILNQVDTSLFPKVNIFATVLKDGNPVIGLTANDFRVKEDEVDQEPLYVSPKLTELNAVITLDTSGSMKKSLTSAQEAANGFLDNLAENDKFSVVSFAREVKILSNSTTKSSAKAAISSTIARGDTALYDALFESVTRLKDTNGRKAIVLLSDGVDDNGLGKQLSLHSAAEGIELAKKLNIPVYVVGLGLEKDTILLQKIANETGGKYFDAPKPEDLKALYDSIGKQLSGQYLINYTSNLPADGSIHRVKLSQGDSFSIKEYVSPNTFAANTTKVETKVVTNVVTETVRVDPGLHVSAVLAEGGEEVDGCFFKVTTAIDGFNEEKQLRNSPYNSKKWSTSLEPGKYQLIVEKGRLKVRQNFEMPADKSGVKLVVNLNAALLQVNAKIISDSPPINVNEFTVEQITEGDSAKEFDHLYGNDKWSVFVPAGKIIIKAVKDVAKIRKEIDVIAGSKIQESLVFNAATLKTRAVLVAGGVPVKGDFYISEIINEFDDPKELSHQYNADSWVQTVPAKKLIIRAEVGTVKVKQEVELNPGEAKDLTIVMNAGLLEAIVTQERGGQKLRVSEFSIKTPKSNFEDSKNIAHNYGTDKFRVFLAQGNYILYVKVNSIEKEIPIEIKAGENLRQEIVLSE